MTDHSETAGQTCDTPTCRYDHAWPKNASEKDKEEFRSYTTMSNSEREEFYKS